MTICMKNKIIVSLIVLIATFSVAIDFVSAESIVEMLRRAEKTNDLKICSEVGRSWYGPCVASILEKGTIDDISFCSTAADDFIKNYCEKVFYSFTTSNLRKEIYIADIVIKDDNNGYKEYVQSCLYSSQSEYCLLRLAIKTSDENICKSIPVDGDEFKYFGFKTNHKKACQLYFSPVFNIHNLAILYFLTSIILLVFVFFIYFVFRHRFNQITKDIFSGFIFQFFIMFFIVFPNMAMSTFHPGFRELIPDFIMDDYIKYVRNNFIFWLFWALGMWWYILFAIFALFRHLWRKNRWLFFVLLILFILITIARIALGIAAFQN